MSTKKPNITPTQARVLHEMRDGAEIGRWPGGFWTTQSPPSNCYGSNWGAPEWSVDVRTVRAMEAKGLLKRTNKLKEEWRDPRVMA